MVGCYNRILNLLGIKTTVLDNRQFPMGKKKLYITFLLIAAGWQLNLKDFTFHWNGNLLLSSASI